MSTESNWLGDLSMVRGRLHVRASALSGLANAFSRIGNELMAEELYMTVKVLNECAESVSSVSGVVTTMLLHQAQENSTNVLMASLAGIELASRKNERCPTCDSKDRTKHPAMSEGGEVQPCSDAWHTETEEGRKALAGLPQAVLTIRG